MRYTLAAIVLFLVAISLLWCVHASAGVLKSSTGNVVLSPVMQGAGLSTKQIASGLAYTMNTPASSTSFSIMSRKCGYARQALSTQQLVYWGGAVLVGDGYFGAEVANDNNETLKAWVEYPIGSGDAIGTTTQATFSGVGTATLNSGAMLTSDPVNVSIPANTEYCIDTYLAPNSGHVTYVTGWADGVLCTSCTTHEKTIDGTSGVPTTIAAFTGASNDNNSFVSPIAVIGPSSGKAICLLGDSRFQAADDVDDISFDLGEAARSVGPFYPYINFGINGQTAEATAYSISNRTPLFQYCDAVIDNLGVNDVSRTASNVNSSAPQIREYKKKLAYLFEGHQGMPALPYSWLTLVPETNISSDNWATCTNQSQTVGNLQTVRTTFNGYMRNPATYGVGQFFDVASAFEANKAGGGAANCQLAVNGASLFSNGTAFFYTTDGTHETKAGNIRIAQLNLVSPAKALNAGVPTTVNPTSIALTSASATYDTSGQKFGTAALSGGYLHGGTGSVPQAPPFTLAGWVKVSTNISSLEGIFYSYEAACFVNATGHFECGVQFGNAFVADSAAANDGTWHYLEVDFTANTAGMPVNTTMHITMCKDGALVGSTDSSVTHFFFLPATAEFGIAQRMDNLAGQLVGEVDDVAVYNGSLYALNGNSCPAAPTQTFTSSTPNLVVGYHLDSNGNATVGPLGN